MWIERRANKRLQVALWCNVAMAGGPPLGRMLTENVSRYGIGLRWRRDASDGLPQVGDLLTVEIELPPYAGLQPKCISCETRVVRVDGADDEVPLIALSVDRMRFRGRRGLACDDPTPTRATAWLT